MRKRVNKYLPEDIREFAMWCMALLVNTDTWHDMKENWGLICEIFINYSTNETVQFKHSYSTLLSRIGNISNNPNSSTAVHQSRQSQPDALDPFEFIDETDDIEIDMNQPQSSQRTQNSNRTNLKNRSVRKRRLIHIFLKVFISF